MKKSDGPFPFDSFDPFGFMERAWTRGWFDNFSNNHFLIMALEHRLNKFDWEYQFVSNTTMDVFTPLSPNGKIDFRQFSDNFIANLSTKLAVLEQRFGSDEIRNFVVNQLSAGKNNYSADAFFQALSEIEILCFYCRIDWSAYIYEPPVGIHGANPEARFEYVLPSINGVSQKIQVNVEVKTPRFPILKNPKQRVALPTILLSDEGRKKVQHLCGLNNMKCLLPRVTKLVSFLNSAASKFDTPKENQYNILYINWSYSDFPSASFLEPWSLLTNELNGILTHRDIGLNLPFKEPLRPDVYNKITAVVVYSSSLDQLMFSDFRDAWKTSELAGSRFRMYVLDKKLEKRELSNELTPLFKITGMRPDSPEKEHWRVLTNFNRDENNSFSQKVKDSDFERSLRRVINTYYLP